MARVHDPRYWQRHFQSQFVPALNLLVEVLERRLLPTFRESDINHEAEAVADEAWESFMSMPGTGEEDLSNFAELAQEAALEHYLLVTGIRQGVVNMFAAGLYHAFEQQLLYFHREELLPYSHQHDAAQLKVSKVKEQLAERGIGLASFRAWGLVEELRLLANAVKHAEGESAAQLRLARPDLFEEPRLQGLGLDVTPEISRPIYLPMIGDDIFVTVDDLMRYRDALIEFWRELGDALCEA